MLPDTHEAPPTTIFPQLQLSSSLKNESSSSSSPIMDLEFTLDTDHRKRRRNRTTQSCLNCHTSKRKCDRKRPCQRCIQLGLTGLCVYEIDDPALRDDPSVDENTRLRNRIAELESLVRELRGKPHPRWADSAFRDGDPNEKWHSRATKCGPAQQAVNNGKRRLSSPTSGRTILPPIKTETDLNSSLYRFSASPPPASAPPRYFAGDGRYGGGMGEDAGGGDYCPCRNATTYIGLSHALDTTLANARGFHGHGHGGCSLYRRMMDLARVMQGQEPSSAGAGPSYDLTSSTTSGSGSPPLPLDDSGAPPGTASSNSSGHNNGNNNNNPSLLSPLSSTSHSFSGGPGPGPGSPHSSSGGSGSPAAFHHAHVHPHHSHSHSHPHNNSHSQHAQHQPQQHHPSSTSSGGSPGEWGGYNNYFHPVNVNDVGMGMAHAHTMSLSGLGLINGNSGGGLGLGHVNGHPGMYGAHVMGAG
ncbi:hypothetical protein C8F01DRAFT_1112400 [Mycena amicta]|nr:hypothetical protein C8F01DRAFT_1112400 [Mycena amicta]